MPKPGELTIARANIQDELDCKITHNAPTYDKFEKWGVERAYPEFDLDITYFDKDGKEVLSFRVQITGYYYCSGSRNFEDINIKFVSHQNNINLSNEQIIELLGSKDLQNAVADSIKDSMIPNDPIGILEQIWDEF
uniref:Uncharacterized protein n=1 Tax=viral metagenome TaxID=1070528 RepID=A0A6C0CYZ1_9ZZZZ